MKSFMAKESDIKRQWYVVDASGMALGRLASQVAAVLRGKNKPEFTPNVDCGDSSDLDELSSFPGQKSVDFSLQISENVVKYEKKLQNPAPCAR